MASKDKESQRDQPEDSSIPKTHVNPVSDGDIGNNSDPVLTAYKTTKHTHTEQHHTIVVNVCQPQIEGEHIKDANKASWWTVKINAGLFICTLILACISLWQGCLTRKSVNTAINVFKSDSGYSAKNLKHQETADSNARISDSIKNRRDSIVFASQKEFYATSKKGVDAQIKTIKDNERFFEDSHAPIMDITNYSINKNNPRVIDITVANEGTQTAEVIENDVIIKADTEKETYKNRQQMLSKIHRSEGNLLVLLAPAKTATFMSPLDSISDSDMELFNKGDKDLYIRVNIYYFNPRTKNIWKLDQVVEFKKNGTGATFSISNTFVKKAK